MARVQVDKRWLEAHDDLLNRAQDTTRLLLQGLIDLERAITGWEVDGTIQHARLVEDTVRIQLTRTRTLHDLLIAIGKPW